MSNMTGEASFSSGNRVDGSILAPMGTSNPSSNSAQQQAPVKRKRNLPGTPDPEAEVIALSPKTLMATNRFVCEICNKGFQRDQNLQLHRRGHNLPWKLRQRTTKEIRKRVYICPEKSCVHHDPSRALGDLTGIKKHFCRKHGEKKWKCDKCSKRYAVQSDWKAHSKTCGTREYRCDCGTLFSRRDSFITHRAFCDALAEESARVSVGINNGGAQMQSNPLAAAGGAMAVMGAPSSPNMMRQLGGGSTALEAQFNNGSVFRQSFGNNAAGFNARPRLSLWLGQGPGGEQALGGNVNHMDAAASGLFTQSPKTMLGSSDYDDSQGPKTLSSLLPMASSNSGSMYSTFFTSGSMNAAGSSGLQQNEISENYGTGVSTWNGDRVSAAARLSLSTSAGLTTSSSSGTNINDSGNLAGTVNNSSAYGSQQQQQHTQSAQMSATALLQKAAQMGATASNSAFRGFGIAGSNSNSVGLGLSWQGSGVQEQQRAHGTTGMVTHNTHNSNLFMKGPLDHMGSHVSDQGGSVFSTSQPFSGSSRSAENAGLHDLMNSLSGGGSGLMVGGSLSAIQSTFGENMDYSGNFTGLNMIHARANMNPMKDNALGEGLQQSLQRRSSSSSLSPSSSLSQQMMMQQGGSSNHTTLLSGMGNATRNEDGSGGDDGLTRDFLGVGGVATAGGMHGRAFSQRGDHFTANFTSVGSSGMDMAASYHTHRAENLSAHGKSWDAAT